MAPKKNDLERALLRAQHVLSKRCGFALVGGLAVSVRASARTTKDVDLAVSVSKDEQAEQLIVELQSAGYQVQAIVEQTAATRLATARLRHPEEARVFLNLLFASSGIEPEIVQHAELMTVLSARQLPVATVGDLMAMKVLSRDDRRRPQDWDDLRSLAAVATTDDFDQARSSLQVIQTRGYQRNRDLLRLFDEILHEFKQEPHK